MRMDSTERIYQCAVTLVMIGTVLAALFGFILGPDYHDVSRAPSPPLAEQPQRTAVAQFQISDITTGTFAASDREHIESPACP